MVREFRSLFWRGPARMELGPPTPRQPTALVVFRREERVPLATKLLEHPDSINPQLESRIFNKLPREIRELIWRFSLTRYEDLDKAYNLSCRYARPGQAAPLRIDVDLLLACRALYVEAFLTPFEVNPILVHDGDPQDLPVLGSFYPLVCVPSDLRRYAKLRPWQLANISSIEMSVQQYNLEGGSVERVSRLVGGLGRHWGQEIRGFTLQNMARFAANSAGGLQLASKKITSLSIRMGRTDWWSWSSSPEEGEKDPKERLRLEPMANVTDDRMCLAMTQGYEARKAGEEPDFGLDNFEKEGRWGRQITEYWPDLATLELVLETFACKQSQLDYVVECAKLWTFPLEDGYHLVWDGTNESLRWRGAPSYRYDRWLPWVKAENKAQNVAQDATEIQWGPTSDGAGQEFIIKTLKFARRKNEERTEEGGEGK
ncbi:hypothetical protein Hte_003190 [Hypoxylon texense]